MAHLQFFGCCGLIELASIGQDATPHDSLKSAMINGPFRCAFVIFSVITPRKEVGERLKEYIEKEKLGEVVYQTAPTTNPNSGNDLIVYLWHVNCPRLDDYYLKHNIAEAHRPKPIKTVPSAF